MSGSQGSEDHKKVVDLASKYFLGEKVINRSNGSSSKSLWSRLNVDNNSTYFPDVVTVDSDIECEMVPKAITIYDKSKKWNLERKKILVLSIYTKASVLFDEVYVLNEGEFVKLK